MLCKVRAVLFFCLFLCFWVNVGSEVYCEHGFCRNFQFEDGCSSPAQHCRINNATHNGLTLPSPTICNCCEYCLPVFSEGQPCSLGGPGNGVTVGRCGAGLTCVDEGGDSYCRRTNPSWHRGLGHSWTLYFTYHQVNTESNVEIRLKKKVTGQQSECHGKQDDYDSRHMAGLTGALEQRPLCDDKGKYGPVDCVPTQTCFCQNEDGHRIFGEVLYLGTTTIQNMHCGCSLMNEKIRSLISPGLRLPVIGMRCTSDGNFNPVQCVGRTCHCVNKLTGLFEPGISIDMDERHISDLPCYDASLDLFGHLSPIGAGPPYNYTSPCYEDMREKLELINQSEEEGFIMDFYSDIQECLPDGTYGRIATTRNRTKICVDDRGEPIEEYEAIPNTEEYENMDCKCAVTSHLMLGAAERPVCCSNGNYRRVQCRRGVCRCVDSDGRQLGLESSDVSDLDCFSDDWRTC